MAPRRFKPLFCIEDELTLLDAFDDFVTLFTGRAPMGLIQEQMEILSAIKNPVLRRFYELLFTRPDVPFGMANQDHVSIPTSVREVESWYESDRALYWLGENQGLWSVRLWLEEEVCEFEAGNEGDPTIASKDTLAQIAVSFLFSELAICTIGWEDTSLTFLRHHAVYSRWGETANAGYFHMENLRESWQLVWYRERFVYQNAPSWYAISPCERYLIGDTGAYVGPILIDRRVQERPRTLVASLLESFATERPPQTRRQKRRYLPHDYEPHMEPAVHIFPDFDLSLSESSPDDDSGSDFPF